MSRPPLEVADLIRAAGDVFLERNRHWLSWKHVKVLRAIRRCRTAALGGHLDECTRCGHRATISYNSCRNRHCPKCQIAARERWIAARRRELLPTRYLHVVFTLPGRFPSLMAKSLFAGVILLTTTNRSCCPYRSMNSCAASYCTFFQKASCASVTSAFWPTANAPRSCLFAFSCWVRHNSRQPIHTPLPAKTSPILGAALNAVDR